MRFSYIYIFFLLANSFFFFSQKNTDLAFLLIFSLSLFLSHTHFWRKCFANATLFVCWLVGFVFVVVTPAVKGYDCYFPFK